MNKLFTKIAAILSATMAVGVGVAAVSNKATGSVGATDTTALLQPQKVTSAKTLTDNQGGSWDFTYVAAVSPTSENNGIHVGTNSGKATSIDFECTSYSSYSIKSISVWAAAKASTNARTHISIGGVEVATSASVLGNTFSSGGTELSYDNTTAKKSGTINVSVSRPSSASGALYLNKIQVVYEEAAVATLSSISLGGSYTTTFDQYTTFNHTGMTVTAHYSDSNTADVTSSATWSSPDMSTAGGKTVTVSYTEGGTTKTETYSITVNAHTHSWVAGTVHAPTCTEAGYTEYSCSCGETKHDDETAALGHNYVKGQTVSPTCTEAGYTIYTCSRCSDSKHDDIVDALGHDWVAGTIHAPTCTQTGYTEYSCSRCAETKHDDETPKIPHNFVNGICSMCGAKEEYEYTFDVSTNPGDWPEANDTDLTDYVYSLNDVDYTFSLKNCKCNSGYLFCTQPAAVGLPVISGKKLVKVVATNTAGCSTSVNVGISSSGTSEEYISGGEKQTWATQSSSYTYTLTGTLPATMYYMYVTNKNAQITSLTLTYEPVSSTRYTVTYDGNSSTGGSVPVDSTQYVANQQVTVLGNTGNLVKTGYAFNGWNTAQDGTGTGYVADATFNISADTTLYAQWATAYDVTFTADEHGSGTKVIPVAAGNYNLPAFSTLSDTISPASGYQFKDYTIGQQTYNAGAQITVGAAVSVTVNFEEIPSSHEVTFDFTQIEGFSSWANSYGTRHDVTYDEGTVEFITASKQTGTITDRPVTKAGPINFVGDDIIIKSATFTLTQWGSKAKTAELYYSTDGGTTYTTTGTSSSNFTITVASLPANTNAIQLQFSESSNQVGITSLTITYEGGSTPTPTTYTIQYNNNGGSGEMSNTTGSAPQVAACTFTAPSGMEFSSWNDDPNGEGDEYAVGATVSANITLYAIWTSSSGDVSEYFTKVTSTSDIKSDGKYIIVYGDLCFDGSLESLDASLNTKSVSLANLLTSYFTIDTTAGTIQSASGKYIGRSADTNGMDVSDSAETNTISIDESGNLVVVGSGGAYLRYNKTAGQERFRYFKSATYTSQQAIQLYKVNLSKCILSDITCNSSGTSAPTGSWSNLVTYYNTLSSADKAAFGNVIADESGTQVEQAMAKYDYIIGKYNPTKETDPTKTDFVHFITSRSPAARSSRVLIDTIVKDSSSTAIIIVTSMIGLSAVGGYFFLRKRKEI